MHKKYVSHLGTQDFSFGITPERPLIPCVTLVINKNKFLQLEIIHVQYVQVIVPKMHLPENYIVSQNSCQ